MNRFRETRRAPYALANYEAIGGPIKVHVEYAKMTTGQLGSFLGEWQALLREAWRTEVRRLRDPHCPVRLFTPPPHIATGNSIDIWLDYAVSVTSFAWITQRVATYARGAYEQIVRAFHGLRETNESTRDAPFRLNVEEEQMGVRFALRLEAPHTVLADRKVAERVERLVLGVLDKRLSVSVQPPSQNGWQEPLT